MVDQKKRIGENLRRLRMEKNYTQEYLGEVLGKTDYTSYQRLEHGKSELKISDAYKLAKFYKIPMEFLYDPEINNENFKGANQLNITPNLNKNLVQMTVNLDGSEDFLEEQFSLLRSVNKLIADRSN
jgi:transcriptional regulator with XRE-family HTH domain